MALISRLQGKQKHYNCSAKVISVLTKMKAKEKRDTDIARRSKEGGGGALFFFYRQTEALDDVVLRNCGKFCWREKKPVW